MRLIYDSEGNMLADNDLGDTNCRNNEDKMPDPISRHICAHPPLPIKLKATQNRPRSSLTELDQAMKRPEGDWTERNLPLLKRSL